MKKFLTFALVLLSAAVLFANGESEASATKPVELEILLSDDTLEGGPMAKAVARFNEEYKDKGIQVKINEIAYADLRTQVLNRAKAKDLPELIKCPHDNDFVDFVLPLDSSVVDDSLFARSGYRNGKQLVTPVNVTAVGMLINKTAFDKAGVAYPTCEEERWTWDEFLAALDKVMADGDVEYGVVIDHSQQRLNTIMHTFGWTPIAVEDHNKVTIRTEEGVEALKFIKSFYDNGYSPVSVGLGIDNAQQMFKTGKVAAHISGNWVFKDYSENIKDFEWVSTLLPYEDEPATCLGGNWLYGFQGTGHDEEIKEFIRWFWLPENYAQYCADGNYIPGMKGVDVEFSVDGLDKFTMEINASNPIPESNAMFAIEHAGAVAGNCLRDAHDKLIAGEYTVEEALEYVEKEYKRAYPDLQY